MKKSEVLTVMCIIFFCINIFVPFFSGRFYNTFGEVYSLAYSVLCLIFVIGFTKALN